MDGINVSMDDESLFRTRSRYNPSMGYAGFQESKVIPLIRISLCLHYHCSLHTMSPHFSPEGQFRSVDRRSIPFKSDNLQPCVHKSQRIDAAPSFDTFHFPSQFQDMLFERPLNFFVGFARKGSSSGAQTNCFTPRLTGMVS
jgi:hypothetical protein